MLIRSNVVRTKAAGNAGCGLVLFFDVCLELTGAEKQENIIRKPQEKGNSLEFRVCGGLASDRE